MQIDIVQFQKDRRKYINDFVCQLAESDWSDLQSAKFQNCTPEELLLMKTLWSHGFMKGAERSAEILTNIYDAVDSAKPKDS